MNAYELKAAEARARRDAYLEREPTPSNMAMAEHYDAEARRYESMAKVAA